MHTLSDIDVRNHKTGKPEKLYMVMYDKNGPGQPHILHILKDRSKAIGLTAFLNGGPLTFRLEDLPKSINVDFGDSVVEPASTTDLELVKNAH